MEQGLITFFDVKEIGFYRQRKSGQEHVSGDFNNTLSLLMEWVRNRDFDQTIPWSMKAHPQRKHIFCKSICHDPSSSDYFIVLWKKFGEDSGNVNGVFAKSKVDDLAKDTHRLETDVGGKDLILGEPMYYWFMPEFNLIASIKFPHSVTDSDTVFNYIKKCIDLRIPHPNKKIAEHIVFNQKAGRDITVKNVSYRSADDKYSMSFKFEAQLKELSINDTSLKSLSEKITHLVIRETIESTKLVNKDSMFAMFDRVRGKKKDSITLSKQVELVTEETLSEAELTEIIEDYNQDYEEGWDNIGFKLDGIDSPTKWFDRYVDRKHILMRPDSKKDNSYYKADTMMAALQRERADILDFMILGSTLPVPILAKA